VFPYALPSRFQFTLNQDRSAWVLRPVPPPVSLARGPPTDCGELAEVHDDRDVFQSSSDELPAIDIHSL
jgi:hypothetical protein